MTTDTAQEMLACEIVEQYHAGVRLPRGYRRN